MINRLILCLGLLLSSFASFSQNKSFDEMMVKRTINCFDVAINSTELFESYMIVNELDSAQMLLNYWEKTCGLVEPVFRAKTILSLHNNTFEESELPSNLMDYLMSYQHKIMYASEGIEFNNWTSSLYDYVHPNSDFNVLLSRMAKGAINDFEESSTEAFLASFYASPSPNVHSMLSEERYSNTKVRYLYDFKVQSIENTTKLHSGLFGGTWSPTGELNVLGTHPNLGFFIGGKKKKLTYDLTLSFKFLNVKDGYEARRDGASSPLENTKHFFGGYFGVDFGREITRWGNNELQLLAGIGLDGFDALKEDEDAGIDGASVLTYNFNIGMGYKYNLSYREYLGLQLKYNVADYSLNSVVDYSGNAVTFSLIWGFYTSPLADSFYYKPKAKKKKK